MLNMLNRTPCRTPCRTLPWGLLLTVIAWTAVWGAVGALLPDSGFAEERIPRSTAQQRPRLFDELREPRYTERENHRGWQLRYNTFQVFSNTSPDDARWAADRTQEAWEAMANLANFWDRQHQNPNFAFGSTLVVMDGQPDLPFTETPPTMQLVGTQMVIHLQVPDSVDNLEDEQLQPLTAQLRHATAHAFLHAAHMDQKLPVWVCEGLARYVSQLGIDAEYKAEALQGLTPPSWLQSQLQEDDPQTWRTTGPGDYGSPFQQGDQAGGVVEFDDAAADGVATRNELLDGAPDDAPDGAPDGFLDGGQRQADTVWFLLQGDDARHSEDLFTALQRTIAEAETADRQRMPSRGPADFSQRIVRAERLEQLAEDTQKEFDNWRVDPLAGQPIPATSEPAITGHAERQRQMAFVLKLLSRFADAPRSGVQPRVREFGKPDPPTTLASTLPRTFDLPQLYRRLSANDQFWATIAPDGSVLLSLDQQQVHAWLDDLLDPRYQAEQLDGQWRLTYRLGDGSRLQAQLLPIQPPALRPTVQYQLIAAAPR